MNQSQYIDPLNPLVAKLVSRLDENLREAFEERAGILEFEALLPRGYCHAGPKSKSGRRPPVPSPLPQSIQQT